LEPISYKHDYEGIVIPDGTQRLDVSLRDDSNENTCLASYFQQNELPDVYNFVLSNLASVYLKRPTYDQLRTEEQLGYVVQSSQDFHKTTRGLYIVVQSNHMPCSGLIQRVTALLTTLLIELSSISDQEFTTLKDSLHI
jgi:secreted Zn-dependent insulinase-like peptidase